MLIAHSVGLAVRFYAADHEDLLVANRHHDAGELNLLAGGDGQRAFAFQTESAQTGVYPAQGSLDHEMGAPNHSQGGFVEYARYRAAERDFLTDVIPRRGVVRVKWNKQDREQEAGQ